MLLYSVGYEGRTLDRFVDLLRLAGVDVLVDVRLTPISRKPGFSKRRLAERLDSEGIEYLHEPKLGNPPENRDAFRTGDVARGRERFGARLENGARDALLALVDLTVSAKVAVLCVERDSERCHRQVITDAAQEMRPGLAVVGL